MIDLRTVVPLAPKHFIFNPEKNRTDFSCSEMAQVPEIGRKYLYAYRCVDRSCRLVYNKFSFAGYYKDRNLPYPEVNDPDNVLPKPRVCRPKCIVLKIDPHNRFFMCTACSGIFVKHPEFGITTTPEDWFIQDPRVLKYLVRRASNSADALQEDVKRYAGTPRYVFLMEQLRREEKRFVTEILSHCFLE